MMAAEAPTWMGRSMHPWQPLQHSRRVTMFLNRREVGGPQLVKCSTELQDLASREEGQMIAEACVIHVAGERGSCRKNDGTDRRPPAPFFPPGSPPCKLPAAATAAVAAAAVRCQPIVVDGAAAAAGGAAGRLVVEQSGCAGGVPAGAGAARRAAASLLAVCVINNVEVCLQAVPVGQGDVEAHRRVLQGLVGAGGG